ncbi:MAG: cellulase family glycosylhydrolase [Burkholderiales bacterium]|nr:cellulase family glycosylhydrolase [Anaerolineae bacterium]
MPIAFVFCVALGILMGCVPQSPIPVYITPTPQPGVSIQPTASTTTAAVLVPMLPTSTSSAPIASLVPTQADTTASPTEVTDEGTPTQVPTLVPIVTNTAAAPPTSAGPTPTFMGAVVGSDYVLPPTSTPRPSLTPTEGPTLTPGPSDTPQGPTGTPLPGIDLNSVGVQLVGINVDGADFNNDLYRASEHLGVGWVKLQIPWDNVQPDGPTDMGESFRRLEIYIEQAHNQGFNVLLSVAKAPDWARSNHEQDGPPDDPQALANFITLMLSEFGYAVNAIEVWNEPNLDREWIGQPINGGRYMDYFRPAYDAIRAYSPTIAIVTAGLAPTSNSAGTVDDRTFLQQMYNAGLANYSDVAVGIHPYGWGNSPDARCCDPSDARGWDDRPQFFFMNTIEDYRNIMVNSGHSNNQLWVTEFGWGTWDRFPGDPPEPWMRYNNEQDQANYTIRALEIMSDLGYIGPRIIWNLDFAVPILIDQRDERIIYSLVLPEGNPQERPLYWMLYEIKQATQTDDD